MTWTLTQVMLMCCPLTSKLNVLCHLPMFSKYSRCFLFYFLHNTFSLSTPWSCFLQLSDFVLHSSDQHQCLTALERLQESIISIESHLSVPGIDQFLIGKVSVSNSIPPGIPGYTSLTSLTVARRAGFLGLDLDTLDLYCYLFRKYPLAVRLLLMGEEKETRIENSQVHCEVSKK